MIEIHMENPATGYIPVAFSIMKYLLFHPLASPICLYFSESITTPSHSHAKIYPITNHVTLDTIMMK